MVDYDSLFEGVKTSLETAAKNQANPNYVSYSSLLKLVGPKENGQTNNYVLRLLPYVKEGKEGLSKTFFRYEKYFWRDEMGNNHSVLSRRTFNEQCPITRYRFNVLNNGTDYEKEQVDNKLKWKQGWYCNVLVVSDPVNPANNGQVKVLSLNKTLWTIIDNAMKGALDDEWSQMATDADPNGREIRVNVGRMVLDLTDNGINLQVKIGKQGQWPDYKQSRFTRQGAKLGLTPEQQEDILNQCQDVTKIEKEMSADDVYAKFKETYLGEGPVSNNAPVAGFKADTPSFDNKPAMPTFDDDDEIPGLGGNSHKEDNTVDAVRDFASSWTKMSNDFN